MVIYAMKINPVNPGVGMFQTINAGVRKDANHASSPMTLKETHKQIRIGLVVTKIVTQVPVVLIQTAQFVLATKLVMAWAFVTALSTKLMMEHTLTTASTVNTLELAFVN